MAYFRCQQGSSSGGAGATITVTYNSTFYNKTMTCTKGTKTYTKTTTSSGSTTFNVNEEGTWTITCNGVSRTVNVVLSYSTQMAITKTITIHGANEDYITYTDATGSKVCQFASGATSKSVSITFIPPSQSITFTSTVAKNPNNLSQNYSKAITITNSTTDIYIMPEHVIYWYGYYTGDIVCSATTGWSKFAWADPTFNTNYVRVGGVTDRAMAIFGSFNFNGTQKIIAKGVTKPSAYYCQFLCQPDKAFNQSQSAYALINQADLTLYSCAYTANQYPVTLCNNTECADIYALWVE